MRQACILDWFGHFRIDKQFWQNLSGAKTSIWINYMTEAVQFLEMNFYISVYISSSSPCSLIQFPFYYIYVRCLCNQDLPLEIHKDVIKELYRCHGLAKSILCSRLKHTTPARVFPHVSAWTPAGVLCLL